jgi:hypothetical protein
VTVTADGVSPEAVQFVGLSTLSGVRVYGLRMKHAGYAHPEHGSVTLRLGLCDELVHPTVSSQTANAVYVLAHELGHVLIPTNDEWKADHYAVTHFKSLAHKLGIPRWRTGKLWRLCPYR